MRVQAHKARSRTLLRDPRGRLHVVKMSPIPGPYEEGRGLQGRSVGEERHI